MSNSSAWHQLTHESKEAVARCTFDYAHRLIVLEMACELARVVIAPDLLKKLALPRAEVDADVCGAVFLNFICTRTTAHTGTHCAHAIGQRAVFAWEPNEDEDAALAALAYSPQTS